VREGNLMFTDGLFRGKRILVTGGGTGLGKGMAERFLELGAELIICGRRKSLCEETAAELMKQHGGKVEAYGIDIRDAAAVDAMAPGEIPTEGAGKRLRPIEMPASRGARLNPMDRHGRMQELQNLATFLLSDGCDWLTGQTIAMDGANALATGGNFYDLREWG